MRLPLASSSWKRNYDMENKRYTIRELVAPIVGGYWGQTSEDGSGNARVVRNGDVQENGRIGGNAPLRQLDDKEITKAQLLPGDTVMTMSGNVGRTAFIEDAVDGQDIPYVASNFIKILRPDSSKVLPKYLFYSLHNSSFENECLKYTRGVAIQNLSTKIFDQPVIKLPSLEEQSRIVALLDDAMSLKDKRALANQKMEGIIPALFAEMFGDGSEWPTKTLEEVCEFQNGKAHEPFVTPEGKYVIVNSKFIASDGEVRKFANENLSPLKENDIAIVMSDIPNGKALAKCFLVDQDDTYALNQRIGLIRTNELNPVFLRYQLNRNNHFLSFNNGQSQTNLRKNQVLSCPVFLPPRTLQDEFAEKIQVLLGVARKQRESTALIEGLNSSFLSKVFS